MAESIAVGVAYTFHRIEESITVRVYIQVIRCSIAIGVYGAVGTPFVAILDSVAIGIVAFIDRGVHVVLIFVPIVDSIVIGIGVIFVCAGDIVFEVVEQAIAIGIGEIELAGLQDQISEGTPILPALHVMVLILVALHTNLSTGEACDLDPSTVAVGMGIQTRHSRRGIFVVVEQIETELRVIDAPSGVGINGLINGFIVHQIAHRIHQGTVGVSGHGHVADHLGNNRVNLGGVRIVHVIDLPFVERDIEPRGGDVVDRDHQPGLRVVGRGRNTPLVSSSLQAREDHWRGFEIHPKVDGVPRWRDVTDHIGVGLQCIGLDGPDHHLDATWKVVDTRFHGEKGASHFAVP